MPTNLRLAIVESGLPQYKVGEKIGVDEFRFSRMVHGRQPISDDQKEQLAEILDKDIGHLFPKEEMEPQAA